MRSGSTSVRAPSASTGSGTILAPNLRKTSSAPGNVGLSTTTVSPGWRVWRATNEIAWWAPVVITTWSSEVVRPEPLNLDATAARRALRPWGT